MVKEKEKWKSIMGYEGRYEISQYGRVKSLPKIHAHRYEMPERILIPILRNGYPCVNLHDQHGKYKGCKISILVARHFIANPNNYPLVMHLDNDRSNSFYKNLQWGTAGMNNKHAFDTGVKKPSNPFHTKTIKVYDKDKKLVFKGSQKKAGEFTGASRRAFAPKLIGGKKIRHGDFYFKWVLQ